MAKIRTNITLDPKTKKEATKVLDKLGLDLSTAISLFLNQVVIHEGLPFDINSSKDNIYYRYKNLKDFVNRYLGISGKKYVKVEDCFSKKEMKQAQKDLEDFKKNPKKYKVFNNFHEVLKDIGIEI